MKRERRSSLLSSDASLSMGVAALGLVVGASRDRIAAAARSISVDTERGE